MGNEVEVKWVFEYRKFRSPASWAYVDHELHEYSDEAAVRQFEREIWKSDSYCLMSIKRNGVPMYGQTWNDSSKMRDFVKNFKMNKCMLKGCDGTLKHYDGALGYEAMVCNECGAHYTGDGAIHPNAEEK